MLEVVTSYTWPTDGISIARLSVRVDDLAARLGIAIQTWDVDGLGSARGFGFRLPSGRVYLLAESDLPVRCQRVAGPSVNADAADVSAHGVVALVDDVVAGLGLSRSEVTEIADATIERYAAEFVAKATAVKAKE
jgi:hypothetical protein